MKTYFKKLALTSSNTSRTMTKWHRQARLKAWFLLILMLVDILAPIQNAYALTSGPAQPEFQSFTPVGTTDMVNTFTGDFNYNIPLFELPGPNGGYPFNLAYNPSAGMDDESGPFGLGWTINPGAITRSMRGLPDDFDGDEVKTTTSIKDNVTLGVNVGAGVEVLGLGASGRGGLFINSYKGLGYEIGGDISQKMGCVDLGLGFNINSQEGISLQPSISLHNKLKKGQAGRQTSVTAGIGLNSREGLSGLTLSVTTVSLDENGNRAKAKFGEGKTKPVGLGTSISFANSSYTPSINMPWGGFNYSLSNKIGVGGATLYGFGSISGNYVHQRLKHKGDEVTNKAYGYLNSEKAASDNESTMMDFNREKDGAISIASPYLPLAMGTADIYNVTNQSGGGMFRPYRSDVGAYHDASMVAETGSNSFSVDVDLSGVNHFGVGVSGNTTIDLVHQWDAGSFLNKHAFGSINTNSEKPDYEPAFFKSVGESTTEETSAIGKYIGGEKPMRINFGGGELENTYNVEGQSSNVAIEDRDKRKPRNTNLIPLKNSNISSKLGEMQIKYYDANQSSFVSEPNIVLSRTDRKPHHIGAFTSLNPSGLRSVYALPAYNEKQVSYTFSVNPEPPTQYSSGHPVAIELTNNNQAINYKHPATDKYYHKEVMPEYAHTHLLTSVLGADYIDKTNDGPSIDDLGYWVKFSYRKSSTDFKWRTPYWGASYEKGYDAKKNDDKGNFIYGEKEVWDLARVETKTHVAIFHLSERNDGHDAPGEFNNSKTAVGSNSLFKVDKIEIFARNVLNTQNPIPMKTIHFEYTYDICRKVWNNDKQGLNNNTGKLTLKKVYFTYEGNTKGQSTPYIFDYAEAMPTGDYSSIDNPEYEFGQYDRWGNYKSIDGVNDPQGNDFAEIPYVRQFDPALSKTAFKAKMDREAAVWHLHKVTLPSGSSIEIEWEAKTYGHVQNKVANQMFSVAGYVDANGPSDAIENPSQRYVYFRLEEPLAPNASYAELSPYINDLHKETVNGISKTELYFRVKSNIAHNYYEYIAGYSYIAKDSNGNDDISLETSLLNSNGKCEWAKIKLEALPNNPNQDHPFQQAAWQYLRTDLPDLAYAVPLLGMPDDESPTMALIQQTASTLLSVMNDARALFGGYYDYCRSRGFGKKLDTRHSFVRLCSPDREKFGGGARVKQITLVDTWNSSGWGNTPILEPNTYGQVYEYYDGVASYEPSLGAEETALRYPKKYTEETSPFITDNNLFVEYPLNENAYPAPSVGYSKVIVKSLATAMDEKTGADRDPNLPYGISTTGKTVNEFYTAKDFPVLTYETEVIKRESKIRVMIPPFVDYNRQVLHGTYGVSTILNDMHGKPKSVASFAQDAQGNYPLTETPATAVSWVEYKYKTKEINYQGYKVYALESDVPCISSITEHEQYPQNSGLWQLKRETRTLGVDYEINNDTRVHSTTSTGRGIEMNTDLIWPIPLPTVWPNVSTGINLSRIATTNKIIRKTGIVDSIMAYNNGALVATQNLLYDALTGQVVLSRVNNSYTKVAGNQPYVYDYKIPAHQAYDGMGAAYRNIGLSFTGTWTADHFSMPANIANLLVPGDELIAVPSSQSTAISTRLIYTHADATNSNAFVEVVGTTPNNGTYTFTIVRSGRRNLIAGNVGEIKALSDPTRKRTKISCFANVVHIYEENGKGKVGYIKSPKDSEFLLDSILSASAVTYSQYWVPNGEQASISSAYSLGHEGIWRPEHSYTYVDDRSQASGTPELAKDGIMNKFIPFDYANPLATFTYYSNHSMTSPGPINPQDICLPASKWVKASTAISYTMENLLESMDALGLYASNLYGYGNALMLASAANARQQEMAYESFEEYTSSSIFSQAVTRKPNSNLVLSVNNTPIDFSTDFSILFATKGTNGNTFVVLDHTFNSDYFTPNNGFGSNSNCTINYNDIYGKEGLISGTISAATGVTFKNRNYTLLYIQTNSINALATPNYFRGKVVVPRSRMAVGYKAGTIPTLTSETAHTGKQCMQMASDVSFNLGSLDLVPNKVYNLSFWLKENKGNLPKIDGTIRLMGTTIPVNAKPVEGWIRVDYHFTAPSLLVANKQELSLEFDMNNQLTRYTNWYVDDIRIMPFDAAMECSVYDPMNYRLRATLDNNHYATFYQYDAEGNLTNIKKETEKGIMTLQYGQKNIKH